MDVNKLKKINQLSAMLKKHGLAASNDDAVKIAGSIEGKNNSNEFSEVIKQCDDMAMAEKEFYEQKSEEKMAREEQEKKGLSEEQIINVLQKFADQFSHEINSMRKKIEMQDDMIRKMSMNAAVTKQAQMSDDEIVKEVISENKEGENEPLIIVHEAEHEPMQRPETVAPKREAPQRVSMTGSYSSSDVSIDKFFYCGNK